MSCHFELRACFSRAEELCIYRPTLITLHVRALAVGERKTTPSRSSNRPLLEIVVAYALLEAALWTVGRTQQLWALATLAWITIATVLSRRGPRELGIGFSGLRRSLWLVPAALAISAAMIFVAAVAGTLHLLIGTHAPPSHIALYFAWAMLQEFLLQSFIFVRMEAVCRSGHNAAVASAVLFALAHLPNPILVPATMVLGLVLIHFFRRYRSLYAPGIVHGIFGLVLSICLPYGVTHNMRVGIAFWL